MRYDTIEIGHPKIKRFKKIKIGSVELKSLERRVRDLERKSCKK